MNLTLDLPDEITSRLKREAARAGVPLEHFAAGVLRREVEGDAGARVFSDDEWSARQLKALEAVVETARGFSSGPNVLRAPLSDWAISRAGAYDETA